MPNRLIVAPFGPIDLDETGGADGVGHLPTPWFAGRPVPVSVRRLRAGDGPAAEAALRAFAGLDATARDRATRFLLDRWDGALDDRGVRSPLEHEMSALTDPGGAWAFVHDPGGVVATLKRFDRREIVIHLTVECAWDEEHGAPLAFQNGTDLVGIGCADDAL